MAGQDHHVSTGDVVYIPGNAEHGVFNEHDIEEFKWLYCFGVDGFDQVIYRFAGETEKSVQIPAGSATQSVFRKWWNKICSF